MVWSHYYLGSDRTAAAPEAERCEELIKKEEIYMFETFTGILIGGGLIGLGTAVLLVSIAIACFWYICLIVGYWRIFGKAGEASWKAIVPLLNTYTRFKLSWVPSMFWLALVLNFIGGRIPEDAGFFFALVGVIISIAALVINAKSCSRLAHVFGHGTGFAVGLFFLEPIFVLILGFNSSVYQGNDF